MRRDVIRAVLGRAAAALAFGLAATMACSDQLTEPLVEAAPAAADGFATTGGDRDVLGALYEATDGPNWTKNDNWLTDAPLDAWHGVETDASGRVLELTLDSNGLTGEIPAELGKLANLEWLWLSNNGLTGEIPPELGNLANLRVLNLGANNLTGEIPPELAKLTNLRVLYLGVVNNLTGEIPPELGNLANLTTLHLDSNKLTGEIPSELGNLANLEYLILSHNRLTGVIPPTFSDLPNLSTFDWDQNAGLCAPGTRQFIVFADSLDEQKGPFCHEADAAVLQSVYHSTLGSAWASSDGWLQPGPLADWYGVETDSISGRVSGLDLSQNSLSGELLSNLASLDSLRELRLDGNSQLGGRLWLGMTDLPLRILSYDGTNLCIPVSPAFRMWLRSIPSHSGTGNVCPPLTDRDVLVALYEATGGPNWTTNDNWLTDAPLDAWHGVRTDASGRVQGLNLSDDGLTGEIPAELGGLANLELLYLDHNGLTGEIPAELGNLTDLQRLYLHSNHLTGEIPSELGNLTDLQRLWLHSNHLTGEIPPELGALVKLRYLYLHSNHLTGEIPPELGNLANLKGLILSDNGLTGDIPSSWGKGNLANLEHLHLANNPDLLGALPMEMIFLPLRVLSYAGTDLCTPAHPAFRTWLRSIPSHSGTANECPPDRDVLVALYEATGGPNWTKNDNWLTDAPLDSWHGVETDASRQTVKSGRVTNLSLDDNNLTGEIPSELGNLDYLERLWLDGNGLTGEIPPELGNLDYLLQLYLDGNGLTGEIPPELGNLDYLGYLFLGDNDLTGEIPPELGNLANLKRLWLHGNDLTGEIPSELGNLDYLESLALVDNDLTGEIPPELGNLANLDELVLHGNGLTGKIPSELGDLANLESLALHGNGLTGEIPAELGKLANLERLYLANNGLTGEIPSELGDLANLEHLYLANNGLTGEIPSELGDLANLEHLYLANNPDLFGALPLGNLVKLQELRLDGTEICLPYDSATRRWLRLKWEPHVPVCPPPATATAYIVQSVQKADFPGPPHIPLVAGKPGLLRVFVTAPDAGGAPIPSGLARFYNRNGSTYSVPLSPGDGAIPAVAEIAETNLSLSANAKVPGDVLRPGVEMVVELDPEGTLDPALGIPWRIPATGRTVLSVNTARAFDVTVVPFLLKSKPDSSILAVTDGLTAEDELFELTRRLLPVGPMSVTVHEPVWTSTRNADDLLAQTKLIWEREGKVGYYMGTLPNPTGAAGVAYLAKKIIFSLPRGGTIAHEFGHTMNLRHAPCGNPRNVDPGYPHAGGVAGAWGWDRRSGRLVSSGAKDVMGYCGSEGISDYHYVKASRWRRQTGAGAYYAGPSTRVLLLWGGVGTDTAPFLNPAFVVDGRPSLLEGAGAWRIVGEAEDGRVLFSQRFEMAETADGDGRSSFALALAADLEWADALSRIVLTGPDGSVAMSAGTGPATALLQDPATGRVRGILHDWRESAAGAQPDAGRALLERGLEVQVSSGIPRSDAWRR